MSSMKTTWQACNARYAGSLHDSSARRVVALVDGYDVFTVTAYPTTGSASTAVLSVQYSNEAGGPWVDFSTAITLGNSTRGSGLVGVVGQYVAVNVTTGEGADSYWDIVISARRSEIPTEVAV